MTGTVEKLPDEPIAIVTYTPPFDSDTDMPQVQQALEEIFKALVSEKGDATLYVIADLRQIELTIQILVDSMRYTIADSPVSMRSSKIRMAFVGGGAMAELAARSYTHAFYGRQHVPVFKTIEEALAYARRK